MEPIQLLRELVALPSVNPALVPADAAVVGEGRVVEFLEAQAARCGLATERRPVFEGRSNLLLRLEPARRQRARVLLAPHMDTVGATPAQLRPVLRRGRLHGRGACDTKGSIAAMFAALAALARGGPRPAHTEVVLAALVDEEHAQTGSRALARSGLKAALAIVGEPTRLEVVTAHKGNVWLRLETRGKAAHGARPELGRNAVLEMARVVQLLETEYAAVLRHQRHPLLGPATISVGTIRGGAQPNIVPDCCQIEADRRTLPGETPAGVCREVAALLRLHGLRASVKDSKATPCWPMATDPDLPWVRLLMRQARQREPRGVHFFCDASVLSQGGIPSVVFGPGNIAQAHTADEWIAVREVEAATAILTRFLRALP
jgi:acetylornithine deacetylase/succinyl-diaminopimelate desuccinylase-like protein